jgi:hypothetical protein
MEIRELKAEIQRLEAEITNVTKKPLEFAKAGRLSHLYEMEWMWDSELGHYVLKQYLPGQGFVDKSQRFEQKKERTLIRQIMDEKAGILPRRLWTVCLLRRSC